MLFFYIALISSESVTGFIISDNTQLLYIKPGKKYENIKSGKLFVKEPNSKEFICIKSMDKYLRPIKDKKEYEEYLEELESDNKEDKEEKKEDYKYFENVYIDLKRIPKDPKNVYYVNVDILYKEEKDNLTSRAFVWDATANKWKISDESLVKEKPNYIVYGVLCAVCIVSLCMFGYLLV